MKISALTRQKVFDFLTIANISWSGSLEDQEFLSRIIDLQSMQSYDPRYNTAYEDIVKHTVMNNDWTHDWVFSDSRFNLLHCKDEVFLHFLSETLHPRVRRDNDEVGKMVANYNRILLPTGIELFEEDSIDERPVYSSKQISKTLSGTKVHSKAIENHLSNDYVNGQIRLMESSVDSNPNLAIGTAKELVETVCKSILEEKSIELDKNWDLPRLIKETVKVLKLSPADITDAATASATIKSILGSLTTVVHGIAELRNAYGSGHGKSIKFKGLSPRHAKLAVGASSTLAAFLIETHKVR